MKQHNNNNLAIIAKILLMKIGISIEKGRTSKSDQFLTYVEKKGLIIFKYLHTCICTKQSRKIIFQIKQKSK